MIRIILKNKYFILNYQTNVKHHQRDRINYGASGPGFELQIGKKQQVHIWPNSLVNLKQYSVDTSNSI